MISAWNLSKPASHSWALLILYNTELPLWNIPCKLLQVYYVIDQTSYRENHGCFSRLCYATDFSLMTISHLDRLQHLQNSLVGITCSRRMSLVEGKHKWWRGQLCSQIFDPIVLKFIYAIILPSRMTPTPPIKKNICNIFKPYYTSLYRKIKKSKEKQKLMYSYIHPSIQMYLKCIAIMPE